MAKTNPGGACLLLVIDEQSAVRELCTAILHREDYEVLAVPDIESAIRLCSRLRWPDVRLVLLDALLPGLDCVRLLKILRLGSSQIDLLFMSNIPADELAGRFGVAAEHPVLQKPFTIPELLAAVRNVLHGSTPGTQIAP